MVLYILEAKMRMKMDHHFATIFSMINLLEKDTLQSNMTTVIIPPAYLIRSEQIPPQRHRPRLRHLPQNPARPSPVRRPADLHRQRPELLSSLR